MSDVSVLSKRAAYLSERASAAAASVAGLEAHLETLSSAQKVVTAELKTHRSEAASLAKSAQKAAAELAEAEAAYAAAVETGEITVQPGAAPPAVTATAGGAGGGAVATPSSVKKG